MEPHVRMDLEEGLNHFYMMVICIKDLVDKNCDDRLDLVKRFADYAIEASEKFAIVLAAVEMKNVKTYNDILDVVKAINAAKSEQRVSAEKLVTSLQCCEDLEIDQNVQAVDYFELSKSVETCQQDVEKATENESGARSTQKYLFYLSGFSALSVVGLIATGPLLYGALGPAKAAIDRCVEAKSVAENHLDEKLDELTVSESKIVTTKEIITKYNDQVQILINGMDDQEDMLKQFRIYRQHLITINLELLACVRLMKTLSERHSLLLLECPLARYSDQCIVFSLHLIYDIMKQMKLPVDIEHLDLPPLPQVTDSYSKNVVVSAKCTCTCRALHLRLTTCN